jgi:signal transduction histidine kinase
MLLGEISDAALDQAAVSPEHRRQMEQLRPRAALVAPLMARNQLLGFLTVARTTPGYTYELPEQALVHDLADRLALAVDNVRLHEEARQAIRARDEFLAVAAHELKTPLTTLQLHVQKLLRAERAEGRSADSAPAQALHRADRQVQRLSALVNDLLDVTRLGAENVALQLEDFDLCALVSEMAERMVDAISKTQSVLNVQTAEPVVGHWDRLRLSQVITNLLSNALKYGAGGPIEVSIRHQDGDAALSVRDHGIGISTEHHLRIFGPFQRAVSERHYGGLGLGLWIAHRIVEAHHGKILVDSIPGQGATFTVVLPLSAAQTT